MLTTALLVSCLGHNGYAVTFSQVGNIASPLAPYLNHETHPQIAGMAGGFTYAVWLRFNSDMYQAHLVLQHDGMPLFWIPFAGVVPGIEFGSLGPRTLEEVLGFGEELEKWHHYAQSWNATTGARSIYIDGVLYSSGTTNAGHTFMDKRPRFTIGTMCDSASWFGDAFSTCQYGTWMLDAQMDDFGIWVGEQNGEDIRMRMRSSVTDRINNGLEQDLLFFYNFQTPGDEPWLERNLGTAGSDYDLMLGRLPKSYEFNSVKFYTSGDAQNLHDFIPPLRTPLPMNRSSWAVPKADDSTAPIVFDAPIGMSIALSTPWLDINFTLADDVSSTQVSKHHTAAGEVEVHIVPRLPPTTAEVNPLMHLHIEAIEDQPREHWIQGESILGGPMAAVITMLPSNGRLYEMTGRLATVAQSVPITAAPYACTRNANLLSYVPDTNVNGVNIDMFQYQLRERAYPETVSVVRAVSISVSAIDDMPTGNAAELAMREDDSGQTLDLMGQDVETGHPLDLTIKTLPTLGKLYHVDTGREITSAYSAYRLGVITEQYLSSVVDASTTWAQPPFPGFHPNLVLGPPSCSTFGPCLTYPAWTQDQSLLPYVGEIVSHPNPPGLPSYARMARFSSASKDGTMWTLEFEKVYKPNAQGEWEQCHLVATYLPEFPSQCLTSLVPPDGRVFETVPRSEVAGIWGAAWGTKFSSYQGDSTFYGHQFFGPIASRPWNPSVSYEAEGYTEYIEAKVDIPVYVAAVEVGMSRGMGSIVSIKVYDSERAQWVQLYREKALTSEALEYSESKRYWRWAPSICRPHFKTDHIRFELDQSSETGVPDTIYFDYAKVIGSVELQPGALPTGSWSIRYVPKENAHGSDSFEYEVTDCPSDSFRSAAYTVGIRVHAVNDKPGAKDSRVDCKLHDEIDVSLQWSDVDVADMDSSVKVEITSLPDFGELRDKDDNVIDHTPYELPSGSSMVAFRATSIRGSISNMTDDVGRVIGKTEFKFTVTDTEQESASAKVTVMVQDPVVPIQDNSWVFGVAGGVVGSILIAALGVMLCYKRRIDLAAHFANARLPDNVQEVLDEIHQDIYDRDDGETAQYIPELANADTIQFGIALCDLEGKVYAVGDADVHFTIQSACKPLLYGMAIREQSLSTVSQKIGDEPSGQPFDALNIDSTNRAYNPYVNAGAMVSASLIVGDTAAERYTKFEQLAIGMSHPETKHRMDDTIHKSEMATNANNRTISAELARRNIIQGEEVAVDAYTRACSFLTTARSAAVMAATLANNGENPVTNDIVLEDDVVQQIITVMMSCGMYNGAGKWIVDVGIPAKSGVAGLLMCVVPGVCGIGIFSPRLDKNGNSHRGVLVAGAMSDALGLHVLKSPSKPPSPARTGSGKTASAYWSKGSALSRHYSSGNAQDNKHPSGARVEPTTSEYSK